MKTAKNNSTAVVFFLVIFSFTLVSTASGQYRHDGKIMEKFINHIPELNDSQKEDLLSMVTKDFYDGLSRKEIRKNVLSTLDKWGIKIPERGKFAKNFRKKHNKRNRIHDELSKKLTNEQRAELRKAVREKRNNAEKEITETIKEKLTNWGIEIPEGFNPNMRFKHMRIFRDKMEKLSNNQRKEIRLMVKEMKNNDKTLDEIRSAVKNKMKKFGVKFKN